MADLQLQQRITQTSRNARAAYYKLVGAMAGLEVAQGSLDVARTSLKNNRDARRGGDDRQVSVDARDKDNRVEQFEVITTILDESIDGGQIGDLYERRWEGEIIHPDYRSSDKLGCSRGPPCPGGVCLATTRPVAS